MLPEYDCPLINFKLLSPLASVNLTCRLGKKLFCFLKKKMHLQFRFVEEPVRRRCRTISLADPNVITRGFELRPSSVDFGWQRDGTFSLVTVVMKNVGVDTCR